MNAKTIAFLATLPVGTTLAYRSPVTKVDAAEKFTVCLACDRKHGASRRGTALTAQDIGAAPCDVCGEDCDPCGDSEVDAIYARHTHA